MTALSVAIPACTVEMIDRGYEVQVFLKHLGSHQFTHMMAFHRETFEFLSEASRDRVLSEISLAFQRASHSYEQGTRKFIRDPEGR